MWLLCFISAIAWAYNGSHFGSSTVEGLLCYLIASVFFVGGAIVFAIKDATPTTTEQEQG